MNHIKSIIILTSGALVVAVLQLIAEIDSVFLNGATYSPPVT